jgi:hypothetical protein
MHFRFKYFLILLVLFKCYSVASQIRTAPDRAGGMQFDPGANRTAGMQAPESGNSNIRKTADGKIDTLRIRTCILDKYLGTKQTVDFDTTTLNFQNNTFPYRNNTIEASHLGNIGSPFQSKIFNDRTEKSSFLFMKPYEQWVTFPSEFAFINTTKSYSNLKYLTTFGDEKTQEEDFKFTFTGNINKYLNIGADYEILYSRGLYFHNANREKLANIFGNYQSPRYEAFWKLAFNYIENQENGGITDDKYITLPLQMSGGLKEYESMNIPTNLTDASSLLRNQNLFFNHKYHIGFERKNKNDTLLTEFVPVTSIIHTLYIDRNQKNYTSESVNKSFYDSAYISNKFTADTCSFINIRNTVGISMREGFHDWVKMGLTAFIEHDFKKYSFYSPDALEKDTNNIFSRMSSYNKNLFWAGAEISKQQGSALTYNALTRLCIAGVDIGDFELSGNINSSFKLFKKEVLLNAFGHIKNLQPDYLLEHYYSNHFKWDNTLSNQYFTKVGGSLNIPDFGFRFMASVENLTNYVYFNNSALPDQFIGNIQVLSANWKQHLQLGALNWDNDIVYQLSSDMTRLPLPKLTIYTNLYAKTMISKVLTTMIGVDCRYFTSYYANSYMPATGQFYTQQTVKVGNYPFMNLYANFHLKRMRFFITYSHASRLFVDPNYFSAPHYPLNPTVIKGGLSWNFYD